MPVLLSLVRHGETDWNRDHRIQGRSDIPLNDTGRAQAAATGRLLTRQRWDAVIASPLSRAFETGAIIARELGLAVPTTDAALVERDYGAAEGLDWEEVRRRFPDEAHVPGRETRQQVADRVLPALLAIARAHPDESVLVVTHGGVIRTLVNELEPDNAYEAIANGSVHSFRYSDDALSLVAFDDPVDELSEQGEPLAAQNAAET
jgi:uncharacterized phosphatase